MRGLCPMVSGERHLPRDRPSMVARMEAVTEPHATGGFSMELSQDQKDVAEWVHGFAANVVRPAAAEWDEREETPWPLIQEAAKIGLYTPELFAEMSAEPSGIGMLTVFEEMFWGDAGIGLSILGTGLAAAALAANGTPEQIGHWLPEMFG